MLNFIQTLHRLLGFLGKRRGQQIALIALNALVGAFGFNVVIGLILRDSVNGAINQNASLLLRALLLAALVTGVSLALNAFTYYVGKRTVHLTMRQIKHTLFEQVLQLPIGRIERQHSGDLISRSTTDVDTLETVYFDQLAGAGVSWFIGLTAIGFAFWMDGRLGLAMVMNGLIMFALSTRTFKPLSGWSDEIQATSGNLSERFGDLYRGIALARMFGIEAIQRRFNEANQQLKHLITRKTRVGALSEPSWSLYSSLSEIIILAIGLPLVITHQVDLGSVLAVAWMQQNATYCFAGVAYFVNELQKALAGSKRVFEVLDDTRESATLSAVPVSTTDHSDIVVDAQNISFEYVDDKSHAVLRNFSLQVRRGQTVALVGESGAGKSTFIKLLLGFYPVSEGEILLNGVPIAQLSLDELRASTAYVSQEAHLFNTSIEENIRYGRLNATHDDIVAAAVAADAHDFIMAQPAGYATVVGERGSQLSGGQKQRIAIARALLKDAPLLLLDEATSALDAESEAQVQHALNRLMKGRTTLIVAHRPSTIRRANWVCVLDQGSIVESGPYIDLVTKQSVYAHLRATLLSESSQR